MQNIGRMFKGVGELSSTLNTISGLAFVVVFILCIAALIMSWLVVPGLHWRTSSKNRFRKTAVWVAIVLYVFTLLGIMFVMRDPGQGYQLRLLPLYGLKDAALLKTELLGDLGNFIIFIPLGILFMAQCTSEQPVVWTMMFSFGFGLLTELLQYIAKMGAFSLEEMICAALGGTLGGLLTYAWQKTKGQKKPLGILLRVAFSLCLVVVIFVTTVFGTYHVLRVGGEKNMQENVSNAELKMQSDVKKAGSSDLIWRDGKAYRFNDEIITVLCMGIDQQTEEIEQKEDVSGESGQADSIFLAVLNPTQKQLSVLAISRDTMTEIATYDAKGNYIGDSLNHLGLEYAFGDGKEKSCQYMVDAVSKLFYGIPINGYVAFNMETISQLNDAVGGVTVTVPEGENISDKLKSGETVTLNGDDAVSFVRYRDTSVEGSNNLRIARQKQYLINFFSGAVKAVQKDVSFPGKLYQDFSSEMVTSIGLDDAVYLVTEATEMSFGEDSLTVLQGETKTGDVYDEVYIDEDALYDLILKTFYTEVEIG